MSIIGIFNRWRLRRAARGSGDYDQLFAESRKVQFVNGTEPLQRFDFGELGTEPKQVNFIKTRGHQLDTPESRKALAELTGHEPTP